MTEKPVPQPDWLLVMAGTPLGALRLAEVDQPWYRCTFDPTPAFDSVRALFAAFDEAVQAGDVDKELELLEEFAAQDIRLIWPDGQREPRPDMEGSLQIWGAEATFRPDRVRFRDGRPVPDA
jgi:hypothetical protein